MSGSTMIHRLMISGVRYYLDDGELAKAQHLLYWCGNCNAYHIQPGKSEAQVVKALEQKEVHA